MGSSHSIANACKAPVIVSIVPADKAEHADEKNRTQTSTGGIEAAIAAAAGPVEGELRAKFEKTSVTETRGVHNRLESHMVMVNPGITLRVQGYGSGDFISIKLLNDVTLAVNHVVDKDGGLIVTPSGAVMDTRTSKPWKAVAGEDYTVVAKQLRADRDRQGLPIDSDSSECPYPSHPPSKPKDVSKKPKRTLTGEEKAVQLWHREENSDIECVCWLISPEGEPTILYARWPGGHLAMLSLSGDPLPLPRGSEAGLKGVVFITVSPDQWNVALVHRQEGLCYWRVYSQGPGGWIDQQEHQVEGDAIPDLSWTSTGQLVVVTQKSVSLYTVEGTQLQTCEKKQTGLIRPLDLHITKNDQLYIADQRGHCIRILTPDGRPIHTVPPTPSQELMAEPLAVCADSSGNWLFVGHRDGDMSKETSMLSMWSRDGTQHKAGMIQPSGWIRSLRLHEDRYLAVGIRGGVFVVDVSSFLLG